MKTRLKKKSLWVFLSVVMVLSIFPAYALTRDAHALKIESVTANAGQQITLPVKIQGNPGFSSFNMEVELQDGLSYAESGAEKSGILAEADGGELLFNNGLVGYMNQSNVNGDGELFRLHVAVPDDAASGKYNITVKVKELTNADDEEFTVSEATAVVTVKGAPTLEIESVRSYPGGVAEIPVKINGNPGFSSFNMEVTLDGLSYAVSDAKKSGILAKADDALFAFNKDGAHIGFSNQSNVNGDGELFRLYVDVPVNVAAGDYRISVEVMEITNDQDVGLVVKNANGVVTVIVPALEVGPVQVKAGDTAKVPVKIQGNPGFSSFNMEVIDIPSGWSLLGAEKRGVLAKAEDGSLAFNEKEGLVGFMSRSNVDGDGELFWLNVNVPSDAYATDYDISVRVTGITNDCDKDFSVDDAKGVVKVTTDQLYTITVIDTEHGRLEVTPNGKATAGTEVTINAIPDDNCVLKELIVKDEKGNVVARFPASPESP